MLNSTTINHNKKYLSIGFILLLILEICSNTILIEEWINLNPIIWFVSSIGTGVLGFIIVENKINFSITKLLADPKRLIFFNLILTGSILLICYKYFLNPIDPHWSDVMPATELYVKRFLSGTNPYDPMPIAEWVVIPNYPPMRWLPFCFSELLHIDYRWTSVIFILGLLWFITYKLKNSKRWAQVALSFCLLFLLIYIIDQKIQFELTSEFIIGFYYVLLGWGIYRNNSVIIALAIVFCIFSRFYVVYFIPIYGVVYLLNKKYKEIAIQNIIIVGVSLLLFLPFQKELIRDYFDIETNFTQRSIKAWGNNSKLRGEPIPDFIRKGLSFCAYFYSESPLNNEITIRIQNKFQIAFCFLAILLISYYYYRHRMQLANYFLYLILGLKILLVVILSFNTCPFPYLYCFPILLNYFFIASFNYRTSRQ